ncbi:hypothetical protein [Streptomyces sp. NPDC049949]|uniref:hypothetical protein n=1 Tax=Streptomyces sp. NPDC049949 TaxID=3154627 RepID=UPI003443D4AE
MEIRENLLDRMAGAEREGWLGEVEGLRVSLAGAESKIGQIDSSTPGPSRPARPARSTADRAGSIRSTQASESGGAGKDGAAAHTG